MSSEDFVLRRFAKLVDADVGDAIASAAAGSSVEAFRERHAKQKQAMLDLLKRAGALPVDVEWPSREE